MQVLEEQLESLRDFCKSESGSEVLDAVDHSREIEESVAYLSSDQALDSLAIDAYWPKWNSPWWHMLLLDELGHTKLIPPAVIDTVIKALNTNYLDFFPLQESELPVDIDPYRHIACHCQLGTMERLLIACGVDTRTRLPWLRPWYARYQMLDGGLNCDEASYVKPVPKGSVLSTICVMEAVLASPTLTDDDRNLLERGANYLLQKSLWRKTSTGEPIDSHWRELCFPRFYHYDVLRGLAFVTACATRLNVPIPFECVSECIEIVRSSFPDGQVRVQRCALESHTRMFDESGAWVRADATTFPLLETVSQVGSMAPALSRSWVAVRSDLVELIDSGQLT